MTAALYISPPLTTDPVPVLLPVIFADTLATVKIWDNEKWVNPGDHYAKIAPSTYSLSMEGMPSSVRLVRKLQIDSNVALAMAGSSVLIDDCYRNFLVFKTDWEREARPMRAFAEYAERYRNPELAKGDLEVLSCYAHLDGTAFNTATRYPPFELGSLGLCAAIGSGANDLAEMARVFEPFVGQMLAHHSYPGNAIAGLAAALNGRRIAQEITGTAKNDWGGYIEFAIWDGLEKVWKRGPSTLNIFCQLERVQETSDAVLKIGSRHIAYDPGGTSARILSAAPGRERYEGKFFQLGEDEDEDPIRFWEGWQPEWVSITAFVLNENGETVSLTKSLDLSDRHLVTIEITRDRFDVTVADELARKIADALASARYPG